MAFDWREFLTLGYELQASPLRTVSEEAVDRVIVSRAYYAAFRHVRDYAEDRLDFEVTGYGPDHGKLIALLRVRRAHDDLAQRLGFLRKLRENCDYDADLPDASKTMVASALKTAEDVFTRIAERRYP